MLVILQRRSILPLLLHTRLFGQPYLHMSPQKSHCPTEGQLSSTSMCRPIRAHAVTASAETLHFPPSFASLIHDLFSLSVEFSVSFSSSLRNSLTSSSMASSVLLFYVINPVFFFELCCVHFVIGDFFEGDVVVLIVVCVELCPSPLSSSVLP